uniref:ankyrin repeat and zinc finger domain-containing protein 1-like n=1 Tax=Styela clava TaxID=7725 RepID=UPI00193AA31A|nr:ankyrin repeat and zinc finger domain-containing protein 1-like [Styela clava]
MTKISLSDDKILSSLLEGLKLGELIQTEMVSEQEVDSSEKLSEGDDVTHCMTCDYMFASRENQIDHYRSDWHRYNLKLKLLGAPFVTEGRFEEIIDDISSISGSESESDDPDDSIYNNKTKVEKAFYRMPVMKNESVKNNDNFESPVKRGPKEYFRNSKNQLLSVYRCILPKISEETPPTITLCDIKTHLMHHIKFCIILLSAGHFAAAVYEGDEVKVHKTFHRYVLRAKQGIVQSVKDKQNANASKSAGATLRRYNIDALTADIQTLLNSWKEQLSNCTHIFLRAPHYNKGIFYNGKTAPFDRKDARISGIPFPTRRPTFNEIKRVHKELYSIQLHVENSLGNNEDKTKQDTNKDEKANKGKAKESEIELTSNIDVNNSKTSDKPFSTKKKQKTVKKEMKVQDQSIITAIVEEPALPDVIDELFTVVKVGDLDGLKAILNSSDVMQNVNDTNQMILHLNQPIGKQGETLLHIAAKAGHSEIIWYLLQSGAEPATKNKSSAVPYTVSSDKATRNIFRKFMAENPKKYDYKNARIPAPLTEEMEKERKKKLNEKKKAQRSAKKEKLKEQNEIKLKEEQEQQDRERFAALSDREKRAIAAERRLAKNIANNGAGTSITVKRCWLCGESLLGKIPFQYLDYQFCGMNCLKRHKTMAK